jgi:hypothetical protein
MADQACMHNASDVSAEVFDAEVVLVNFTTGRYFALRGAGVRFWAHLASPVSAQTLGAAVAQEFGAPLAQVQADAARLLDALSAEGLVIAAPAEDHVAPEAPAALGAYETPALDVFDELEELIALDPIHDADADVGWPTRPGASA